MSAITGPHVTRQEACFMLRYTLMPFIKLCFFKAPLRPTNSKIALNSATASNFDEYDDVDVQKEATSVLQLLPQQRPHR